MQVIEQRQLISQKNLVGCDTIISRKPLCAKIEIIQSNNFVTRGGLSFLLFVSSNALRKSLQNTSDSPWIIYVTDFISLIYNLKAVL